MTTFTVNKKEANAIRYWLARHDCTKPPRERAVDYTFSQNNGIGTAITVTCACCKKTKNVTDYASW